MSIAALTTNGSASASGTNRALYQGSLSVAFTPDGTGGGLSCTWTPTSRPCGASLAGSDNATGRLLALTLDVTGALRDMALPVHRRHEDLHRLPDEARVVVQEHRVGSRVRLQDHTRRVDDENGVRIGREGGSSDVGGHGPTLLAVPREGPWTLPR